MLFNFGKPDIQVIETFPLKQVKAEYDALCALVIGIGDRSVPFLPCRVPNLQLHLASAVINRTESEINTDRRRIVLNEIVVGEADQQAGLAHARVPQQHQLEQVIVFFATEATLSHFEFNIIK